MVSPTFVARLAPYVPAFTLPVVRTTTQTNVSTHVDYRAACTCVAVSKRALFCIGRPRTQLQPVLVQRVLLARALRRDTADTGFSPVRTCVQAGNESQTQPTASDADRGASTFDDGADVKPWSRASADLGSDDDGNASVEHGAVDGNASVEHGAVDGKGRTEGPDASNLNHNQGSDPAGGFDTTVMLAGGFVACVMFLVTIGWVSGGISADTFMSLAQWFDGLGPASIAVYGVLYFALELIAVIPATILTLGAGYLFGVVPGSIIVSIASTAAAAAGFLIARYGLRDYVSKIATNYPKFRAIDRAIGREGFKFVFLLRLSPLLPFAISNYLYGLTSVRLGDYMLASWLGMLPGTIAYVSTGAAVSALTDLSLRKGSVNPALLGIGISATVLALVSIGKLASAAISEAEVEEDTV